MSAERKRVYVLLFGLLMDLAGAVVIAYAVLEYSKRHYKTVQEELDDLEHILEDTKILTEYGLGLIIAGFVLIFGAEAYSLVIVK